MQRLCHTLRPMRFLTGARCAWVVVFAFTCFAMPTAVRAQQRAGQLTVPAGEDESSTLPWRGTTLTFSQALNLYALSRSAQLSYDPTYAWTFILQPRFYLTKKTYLNLDQRLAIELTDSNTTLNRQRAMLSDTVVGVDTEFWSIKLPRLGELALLAGAHVIAPSSIASRAATMLFGLRGRAGTQLTFEHVLHGASLGAQVAYSQRFLRHNTLEASDPYPCVSGGSSAQNCGFLGSTTNVRNVISAILTGTLELNKQFAIEMLVWLSWVRGADLAPSSVTTSTGFVVDLPDSSATHWRNDRYLVLGLDWNATDWLSLGLSLIDYFPERNPDGTLRSLGKPIDLLVGLSATVSFDKLYLASIGRKPKDEPGQH
jgi:hypothetical protein